MYLEVNDLCKSYGEGGSYTQVLKNVSLEVQQGDMCVIQGTSGSGNSYFPEVAPTAKKSEMMPLVILVSVLSVIIFLVVLYLMIKVMIDRMTPAEVLKNRE